MSKALDERLAEITETFMSYQYFNPMTREYESHLNADVAWLISLVRKQAQAIEVMRDGLENLDSGQLYGDGKKPGKGFGIQPFQDNLIRKILAEAKKISEDE